MIEYLTKSATLSGDDRYRYDLERSWSSDDMHEPVSSIDALVVIMFNPSTADAMADDPTIQRVTGFAVAHGYTGFTVLNLFALRTPHPRVLLDALDGGDDAVGPQNDAMFDAWLNNDAYPFVPPDVLVAWGSTGHNHPAVRRRTEAVVRALPTDHVYCLGENEGGHPRHPLYLPIGTEFESWMPTPGMYS